MPDAQNNKSVAVLGGGVAGLSAAHHLMKHGYQVTVFDSRGRDPDDLGGKARSYDDTSSTDRRFGEHGFRFFPGFYQHVVRTMAEVPTGASPPEPENVEQRLVPLADAAFFARRSEDDDDSSPAAAPEVTGRTRGLATWAAVAWALTACILWSAVASWIWWSAWLATAVVAIALQAVVVALTADDGRALVIALPQGPRHGGGWLGALVRAQPVARWVLVPAILAGFALGPGLGWWPVAAFLAGVVWLFPLLVTVGELWGLVAQIPLSVRPGVLESAAAFFRVAVVMTSSPWRLHTQWEHESWWSYIGASRFSKAFKLAFATGLTRSFVATRAESMSARTGASILAQLLYDVSMTMRSRERAADRVLCGPTHEAWIRPWVEYLDGEGVRFNQFTLPDGSLQEHRRVDVTTIVAADDDEEAGSDRLRIDNFAYLDPDEVWLAPQRAPQDFDHYVLAVAGTAAQRIVANSPSLVSRDRELPAERRPIDELGDRHSSGRIPQLHGILNLQFGWMTGIVYHLTEPVDLPAGHLLCLESEWALTAIEQSRVWAQAGRNTDPWKAIISVNVSDWESPTPRALPARLEDLGTVAAEAWRQLTEHVATLSSIQPSPEVVTDTAINDPAVLAIARGLPIPVHLMNNGLATYEHLPLNNDERLLINTAGSWDLRPTARTAFDNFVLAGDYVRTVTDFASMEAADEAARRAVNVILERDGRLDRCVVADELEVPRELRLVTRIGRWLDRVATRLHLPHPLSLLAAPCDWLAGIEVGLRDLVRKLRPREGRRPRT